MVLPHIGLFSQKSYLWLDDRDDTPSFRYREYGSTRISPDGTRAALEIRDQENDIWTWDFGRKTLTRITFDPGLNRGVVWSYDVSPDGKRFLMTKPAPQQNATQSSARIVVVVNWYRELQ